MKKAKECSAKGHSEEGEDCHKEVVARHTPGEGSQIVHQGHQGPQHNKGQRGLQGHLGHLVSEARVFMEL